jgi:hypothetical protein
MRKAIDEMRHLPLSENVIVAATDTPWYRAK